MKHWKKWLAGLLAAAIFAPLFAGSAPSYAADSYVITITEDTLLREAGDNEMAVYLNGLIYVPYTTLQKLSGVGCTYNSDDQMVTVFQQGAALYFELDSGRTYTYGNRPILISAQTRGDMPYIPVQVVCTWLNLYYSYTTAADSGVGYPVIRIAGSTPSTSDGTILSRNAEGLALVAEDRNRLSGLIPDDPTVPDVPPIVQPPAPPVIPAREISLLFVGLPDEALSTLMDTLAGAKYSAAFFLPAHELTRKGDALREIWCRGFNPGIALSGEDLVAEAKAASQVCAQLLHVRVRLVTCTRAVSMEEMAALTEAGFVLWLPAYDPYSEEQEAPALLADILQILETADGGRSLRLRPDSLTMEVLPVVCGHLSSMNYTVKEIYEWTEPAV